jgi:hypothetical protein
MSTSLTSSSSTMPALTSWATKSESAVARSAKAQGKNVSLFPV